MGVTGRIWVGRSSSSSSVAGVLPVLSNSCAAERLDFSLSTGDHTGRMILTKLCKPICHDAHLRI